jgi:hypothetical protein
MAAALRNRRARNPSDGKKSLPGLGDNAPRLLGRSHAAQRVFTGPSMWRTVAGSRPRSCNRRCCRANVSR